MSLTFAENLTKMIDAGLGGEVVAPDTSVAIGYRMQYNLVSGPVASWNDPEGGFPINLVTAIEPIQDLHGQANPYPAGGGKNLFSGFVKGYNIADSTGEETASSTSAASGYIDLPETFATASYYLSGITDRLYNVVYFYDASHNYIGRTGGAARTSLLLQTSTIVGSLTGIEPSTCKSVRVTQYQNSNVPGIVDEVDSLKTQIEKGTTPTSYAPYSNICPISGRTFVDIWHDATHDTSADPTLTIQLGDTVYGGSLNVTSGVLTVNRAFVDLGTLTWTTSASGRHNTTPQGIKPVPNTQVANMQCSAYRTVAGNTIANEDYVIGIINNSSVQINDSTLNGSDAATFKAAMSGVQLVYELATPQTVQLSPQTINSLLGQNNVWSDAGDVSVTWKEKLYTEGY